MFATEQPYNTTGDHDITRERNSMYTTEQRHDTTGEHDSTRYLKAAFRQYASDSTGDRVIYLSPADYGYREMALNLYKTSYERFNITNHLFVALDNELCDYLTKYGANCEQYTDQLRNCQLVRHERF
jgi:hypothetical protein